MPKLGITGASLGAAVALLCASEALADAGVVARLPAESAKPMAVAHADLRVVVDEVVVFGLGPAGASMAQMPWIPAVKIGVSVGEARATELPQGERLSSASPASARLPGGNGVADTDEPILPVYVFSNNDADVTITKVVADDVKLQEPVPSVARAIALPRITYVAAQP